MLKRIWNRMFNHPKVAPVQDAWKMPETPASGKKTFFMEMPEPMEEQSRKGLEKCHRSRCRRSSRHIGYHYPTKKDAARVRRGN